MKKWIKQNKTVLIRLGILIFFIFIWVLLGILKKSQDFCEDYSRGFGRILMTIIAATTKYFPISMMEVLAVCAAVGVVLSIIAFIKRIIQKNFLKASTRILDIAILVFSVVSMLSATTQPQYNRKAPPIPLYQEQVDKTEFMPIINHFLDDYNDVASKLSYKENGEVISPYSMMEMNLILEKEFKRLDDPKFNNYFNSFTTHCKPLISSEIFSHLQVTGITVGAFGEANVNTAAPTCGIPFTMAHELAHTKGVMREEDANLVALYITLTSEDSFFRYSGYFYSFTRLLGLASFTGNKTDYGDAYSRMDPNIIKEYRYNNKYWDEHDLLQEFQDWINNWYLKSSGEEQGTGSYNDTPIEIEHEIVVTFSTYQKVYFAIYYNI